MEKELRVSAKSDPMKVAGTIASYIKKGNNCNIYSIGEKATYLTVKALSLVSITFKLKYYAQIKFSHFLKGDKEQTAIVFIVQPQERDLA